jgi:anti-sigma B factor antagonist
MRRDMRIDIRREDGLVVMNITGSLDQHSIQRFESEFNKQVERKTPIFILIMRECTYVDSSGINSLVRCKNTASLNNIEMMLCDVHENVSRIFKIAGLNQYIKSITKRVFNDQFASAG